MSKIEKLTLEKLKNLMQEEFSIPSLNEEDPIFDPSNSPDSNKPVSGAGNDLLNLNAAVAKLGNKLSPQDLAKYSEVVNKSIATGNINYDYNLYKTNPTALQFICTALASKYQIESGDVKNKIRSALFILFNPFGRRDQDAGKMSFYFQQIAKFLGKTIGTGPSNSTFIKSEMDKDNIVDSIYKAIDVALEEFDGNQGTSFDQFLNTIVVKRTMNLWKKQNTFQDGKERYLKQTSSLDQPLGTGEDGEEGTLGDVIANNDGKSGARTIEKLSAKQLWSAINSFITKLLSKNPKYLEVYKLYTLESLELDEIAQQMNTTNGNVRAMKTRAEEAITSYIEDGTLQKYIEKLTGEKVNVPLYLGKGSTKEKFVFPRINESMDFIELNEGIYTLNLQQFYNETHAPEPLDYAQVIVFESQDTINKINAIYNNLTNCFKILNEAYDGNHNIGAANLAQEVRAFVDETIRVCRELDLQLHEVYHITQESHGEFKEIVSILESSVGDLIKVIQGMPGKLNVLANRVAFLYNPNSAFGVSE